MIWVKTCDIIMKGRVAFGNKSIYLTHDEFIDNSG